MSIFIEVLLYFVTILFGGASFGAALENYKHGKYGGCGMNIMVALTMVKLMFAI